MYRKTRENGHRVVMFASLLLRASAVLGKFLPPEEMEAIKTLLSLKSPNVNWNFPLSEILGAYNQQLLELVQEECALNYSETALVIQNSTNVFERRVENLHAETCGLMQDLNEHDAEHEAAKASKPRHRSARAKLDLETIESADFLKDSTRNCFLKPKRSQKKAKLLSQRFPQLEDTCRHKYSLNVIGTQGDTIGKKYEFRCNQHLTSSNMLVDELSPDDLIITERPLRTSTPLPRVFDHRSNFLPAPSTVLPTIHEVSQEISAPNSPVHFPEPQETSDLETDDFFDYNEPDRFSHSQESGYCTFTQLTPSTTTSTPISLDEIPGHTVQNGDLHETSSTGVPEGFLESFNGASTRLGPPSEDPPDPALEPPEEQLGNPSRKRTHESEETDAGYKSGSPEDVPAVPERGGQSKRLKETTTNEVEESYQGIPCEAPIPEKFKCTDAFKVPRDKVPVKPKRTKKRKLARKTLNQKKPKRQLTNEAHESSQVLMYPSSISLSEEYRRGNKELQGVLEETMKKFAASQLEAVLGENEELRGFVDPSILLTSLTPKKNLQEEEMTGKDGNEEMNVKTGLEGLDERLQELQEASCSYTPPRSPAFSVGFGGSEDEEDDQLRSSELSDNLPGTSMAVTHHQRIEKRMRELQQEFDVRHDRAEETARWFDMMETLKRAERRPVFDVREHERRIVKGLGKAPDKRLEFKELAKQVEPEDIARLLVASLHLANTMKVGITPNEHQSSFHLNLLEGDASQLR